MERETLQAGVERARRLSNADGQAPFAAAATVPLSSSSPLPVMPTTPIRRTMTRSSPSASGTSGSGYALLRPPPPPAGLSATERSMAPLDAALERVEALRALCEEFAREAARLGTVIIEELFVPAAERTLLPQTSAVGGVAGGEKYIHNGIFFKFPLDHRGLYAGDEHMMKSAKHEFNSFTALVECRVSGLCVPLISIIDFRGWRLVAESVLPIGARDTLVVGTCDGGHSIKNRSPEMDAKLRRVAQLLNLRSHKVAAWDDSGRPATVHTAVDVEGHLGPDGRFYVVDAARLFPPTVPTNERGAHLYKLFRPQFVKNFEKPLCSDAFSGFNVVGREEYEKDIRAATACLRAAVAAQSRALDARFGAPPPSQRRQQQHPPAVDEFPSFVAELHRRGINVRFLGEMRLGCRVPAARAFLLTEIVARAMKNTLRTHLRTLKTSASREHSQLVAGYFDLLFGGSSRSDLFWRSALKDAVLRRFSPAFDESEMDTAVDARTLVMIPPLPARFAELVGASVSRAEDGSFRVDELFPVVRYMHLVSFQEATALSQTACLEAKICRGFGDALFQEAEKKYEETLRAKPDSTRALHNWALSLEARARTKSSAEEALELLEKAAGKYREALEICADDAHTLALLGNSLIQQAQWRDSRAARISALREAIALFERSAASPRRGGEEDDFLLWYNWGAALLHVAALVADKTAAEGAVTQLRRAVECRSGDPRGHQNCAIALSRWARLCGPECRDEATALFAEACMHFAEAARLQPHAPEAVFNWGNTLFRQAQLFRSDGYVRLLFEAAEKFRAAVELSAEYADALYNWGKVLGCLQHALDCVTEDFLRSFDAYLGVLGVQGPAGGARRGPQRLKPLRALARSRHAEVRHRAARLIAALDKGDDGATALASSAFDDDAAPSIVAREQEGAFHGLTYVEPATLVVPSGSASASGSGSGFGLGPGPAAGAAASAGDNSASVPGSRRSPSASGPPAPLSALPPRSLGTGASSHPPTGAPPSAAAPSAGSVPADSVRFDEDGYVI